MPQPIHIIILEDNASDVELLKYELKRSKIDCTCVVVDRRAHYEEEIARRNADLILSDYTLPDFNGMDALQFAQQFLPDVPFIIVTGTLSEEVAVELMKSGASDYVLKSHLRRIGPAIDNAMKRQKAIDERRRAEEALRFNENRLRRQLELSSREFHSEEELMTMALEEAVRLTSSEFGYVAFLSVDQTELTRFFWSPAVAESIAGRMEMNLPVKDVALWQRCIDHRRPSFENAVQEHDAKSRYHPFHPQVSRHLCAAAIERDSVTLIAGVLNKNMDYDELDAVQFHFFIDGVWKLLARMRNEAELRKLIRAVEQSPSSIVITDRDGNIEYVNPVFGRITGYTNEEVIGHNPRLLKSGEIPSEEYAFLWETILSGNVWKGKFHNKKKNGELFWERASIAPVKNEFGEITHFIAVKDDITEQIKMTNDLIAAKERAERSDKLKDAFIANISHELRTPLNIILGYTHLIKEDLTGTLTPDQQSFFESVDRGGQRLMRTVEEILSIARLESNTMSLKAEPLDLVVLCHVIVADFQPAAQKKNLSLLVDSTRAELWIEADRYCVEQALINLIDNAIKYTHSGVIHVHLDTDDRTASILVSDTGVGIAEEYLPHLFTVFSQERVDFSRPYEGLGLGLALTKRYASLNDGTIDVQSTKGMGSKFTLTFPRYSQTSAPSPVPVSVIEEPALPPREKRKLSVLVIEDDVLNQEFMHTILSRDYAVSLAATSVEAFDVLTSVPVDLVLMDLSLRDSEGGLDVTRRIKSDDRYKSLPVIAVTAHAFQQDRKACFDAGCEGFLSKPFAPADLIATIEKHRK